MQQDSRPSGSEHHRHLARRRIDGVQLDDRLPRGFLREIFGRFLVQEEVERDASAAAGISMLRSAVGLARQRQRRSCAPWAAGRN